MQTQLSDRTLWFDGDFSVEPQSIFQYLDHVRQMYVTKLSPEIKQYNALSSPSEQLTVKTELKEIDRDWKLPEEYESLDILGHLQQILQKMREDEQWSDDEFYDRLERTVLEYKEFKRCNLVQLLRTLIFIINTFEHNDVVWGPGRGSSVSSYVLYLIRVHDVDSVFFELEISDFMKDIL